MNTAHYQYAFEKLDVWLDARQFVKHIYSITKSIASTIAHRLSTLKNVLNQRIENENKAH